MMLAWIIMQTEPGMAAGVTRTVAQIAGVVQADLVAGYYDVIACARAGTVDELGSLVDAIRAVQHVTRVLVCWRQEPEPAHPERIET